VPVAVLLGLAFAGPVSAIAVAAERDPFNPLFRFGIIPMFLFSGTFFPVTQLPHGLREIAYATPLWNAVDLTRHLTFGNVHAERALLHVAYLALWIAVGVAITYRAHRRKLIK
jgi:lipooligosaccharide transport system permease protein